MGLRLPKVDTNFGNYTDAQLIAVAQHVVDSLGSSPSYPALPIPLVMLQGFIDAYIAAAAAAVKGSKAETAAKQAAKTAVIGALRVQAQYVNSIGYLHYKSQAQSTQGFAEIEKFLSESGFKIQKTPTPVASVTGLETPIIKKLISSTPQVIDILLRMYTQPQRGKKLYIAQTRTAAAGITPAGPWKTTTFTSGNKMQVPGNISGTTYDVQVAAVGGRDTKTNTINPINYSPIRQVIVT